MTLLIVYLVTVAVSSISLGIAFGLEIKDTGSSTLDKMDSATLVFCLLIPAVNLILGLTGLGLCLAARETQR